MHYIFTIEGNIGSGKSTLVKKLKKEFNYLDDIKIIFLDEPVSVWENIKDKSGKNIIEKYYENQKKYAFSFQMMAYISRIHEIKEILKTNKNVIIISERSVFTDKEIFAKMLYDDNKIEEIEYKIYLKWFDEFVKDIPISGIIYVKTKPEICERRVIKRNRKGENIPLSYLKNCYVYHENWLNNENIPILTLNGNEEFITDLPNGWFETIKIFIKDLSIELFNNNMDINLMLDSGITIF
jgi:deoxyadenosine/deoxycytidine kinase